MSDKIEELRTDLQSKTERWERIAENERFASRTVREANAALAKALSPFKVGDMVKRKWGRRWEYYIIERLDWEEWVVGDILTVDVTDIILLQVRRRLKSGGVHGNNRFVDTIKYFVGALPERQPVKLHMLGEDVPGPK